MNRLWLWIVFALALSMGRSAWAQLPVEPVRGYVYIEPFELRKEIAVYLRALPEWKIQAESGAVIAKDQRQAILDKLSAELAKKCPLERDGKSPVLELDQAHFLRIEPDLGAVPDDRETIPVSEALVAVVFATAQDGYPAELSLQWDYYPGEVKSVEVTFVARSFRKNLTFPQSSPPQTVALPADMAEPALLNVPAPPPSDQIRLPVLSLILMGLALTAGLVARFRKQVGPALSITAAVSLLGGVFTWNVAGVTIRDPYAAPVEVDEPTARDIVTPLLRNIYHAFDYRTESRIYDTLEASVEGNLLEEIYLDIRKGLELEELGGPRVRVEELDIRQISPELLEGRDGFRAEVQWVALGSVTHWGHVHQRLNKYGAWMDFEPVNEQWQLTRIEIIEEGRLPVGQPGAEQ